MTITAINKKYQSALNKAYKAYRKYYALVDLENDVEPCSRAMDSLMLKQERAFDQYLEIFDNLPARERVSFAKQHLINHGYT
jgi:hypothetical protein